MNSIGISFNTVSDTSTAGSELTASLYDAVSHVDGLAPNSALCTLNDPPTFSSSGVQTFSAPTTGTDLCPTLAASTRYFVVVTRANTNAGTIYVDYTPNTSWDSGAAAGWSLPGDAWFLSSSTWAVESGIVGMIDVRGEAVPATPGVTVSESTVSVTEGGATDTYTVVLDTAPTGDVTIAVTETSDDISLSATTLTFGTATWNTSQTVTVTAVDDAIDEAEETATITHSVSATADATNYPTSLTVASVGVTVTDNDTRGVSVSKTSVTVSEAAGTDTYTIKLDSEPTGTVSIAVASGSTSNATVSPSSLSFSASDWSTTKTVTITGVDDSIVNASSRTATISHTVSGADYGSVTANSVSVTVTDDDTAALELTRKQVTGFALHSDTNNPKGIWGNDDTIWVTQNGSPDELHAYDASDGSRDSTQDFEILTAIGNAAPTGICSDGTTMFVADFADTKVYAYNLATKAGDIAKEFNFDSANAAPEGLWCDATHIWVVNDANSTSSKIFAYQRSDGSHVSSMDFDASTLSPSMTDAAINNSDPRDAWGNGTTLFTVDDEDQKIYSYKMSDRTSDNDKNIDLDSDNDDPEGLWFDGRVLWVVDRGDDYVYAYDLPGAQPDNTPANGAPAVRTPATQDVLTATLTAGSSNISIGYVTVPSPTEGSISVGTFTVDGTTYTVVNLYDDNVNLNSGSLILTVNPEPPREFIITAAGVSYSSSSASRISSTNTYTYIWNDANLSWSASDTIAIILSVDSAPTQGSPVTADTTGITDDEGLTTAGFLYQWFRMDGTTETELANETSSTYTPTADDVDKDLKVRVVFDDDAGNQEYPRTSRQIGPVNVLTVPDAPTALTATPAPDTTPPLAFDLTWSAPASDGIRRRQRHHQAPVQVQDRQQCVRDLDRHPR